MLPHTPFPSRNLPPLAAACLVFALALAAPLSSRGAVGFLDAEDGTIESPEGKHLLRWEFSGAQPSPDAAFELQYSDTPEFTRPVTRYRGRDTATSITGLNEGDHHFRIRLTDGEINGAWSAPVTIRVRYVGRGVVITLMTLGLLLFAATVGAVLKGHRDNQELSA